MPLITSMSSSPSFSVQQRKVIGLFLGIAAGDRNGGPMRMLVRVAESLAQTSPNFVREDLARRYYCWMFDSKNVLKSSGKENDNGGTGAFSSLPDTETAFDTGAVFYTVFFGIKEKIIKQSSDKKNNNNNNNDAASSPLSMISNKIIDEAAAEYFAQNASAGANPCHRNSVLAVARDVFPDLASLAIAAKQETTITHIHNEAIDTSIAVNVICRVLIERGHHQQQVQHEEMDVKTTKSRSSQYREDLTFGVNEAKKYVRDPLLRRILDEYPYTMAEENDDKCTNRTSSFASRLDNGGRSPLVLQAALYFLFHNESFESAMFSSLAFAGGANFCPVLVGSIGGCLFGIKNETLARILSSSTNSWMKKYYIPSRSKEEDEDDDNEKGITLETLRHPMVNKNDFLTRLVSVATHFSKVWQ